MKDLKARARNNGHNSVSEYIRCYLFSNNAPQTDIMQFAKKLEKILYDPEYLNKMR